MKVQLVFISLMLVVSCTADPYVLQCTRNELGVLWPIYEDITTYYICKNIAQPVVMNCNAGTQFTFVYQSCVLPAEYIPAPPLDKLPTDAPPSTGTTLPVTKTTIPVSNPGVSPTTASTIPPFTLPTPQQPPVTEVPPATPSTAPPSSSSSSSLAPPTPKTTKSPPTPQTVTTPGFSGPPSPAATNVPMPETPMPTPPVVEKDPPTPPPGPGQG